jgi:hypothetical protein
MRWRWIILIALAAAGPARADSWMLPTRAVYFSTDKTTRLTVIPRALGSQLAYFNDKVAGREPAGQRAGETNATARAMLERRVSGRWIRVWEAPLVNEVAPVSALVSRGGEHVATFDNWHSMGLGDNVVAIYGPAGRLVRALRLDQIIPADYINALPRSVSSLHWSGEHQFTPDGKHLMLAVVVPSDDELLSGESRTTVNIDVDVATGAVAPPSGAAWRQALATAVEVSRHRDAAELARQAAFKAPLRAPATEDEREWHDYLLEAFFRLDRDWKASYPSATVLRAPSARDYKPSEGWVHDALTEASEEDVVMLAAPAAPYRLVTLVQKAAAALPAGKLRGVRVYLAVPPAEAAAIRTALVPSGAEIVALDLNTPIPQRPERLAGQTPMDDDFASATGPVASTVTAAGSGLDSPTVSDDLASLADALEAEAEAPGKAASSPAAAPPQ